MAASAKELPTAITAYEAIDEVSDTITNVHSTDSSNVLHPHKIIFIGNLLCTAEPHYCGHHWDPCNCPDFKGVLNSGVVFYRIIAIRTKESVHI